MSDGEDTRDASAAVPAPAAEAVATAGPAAACSPQLQLLSAASSPQHCMAGAQRRALREALLANKEADLQREPLEAEASTAALEHEVRQLILETAYMRHIRNALQQAQGQPRALCHSEGVSELENVTTHVAAEAPEAPAVCAEAKENEAAENEAAASALSDAILCFGEAVELFQRKVASSVAPHDDDAATYEECCQRAEQADKKLAAALGQARAQRQMTAGSDHIRQRREPTLADSEALAVLRTTDPTAAAALALVIPDIRARGLTDEELAAAIALFRP